MKLQISVSAASLLTPFGKQVRALESQAAKARKLFDAAKEAEAAGKNIDTRVARLQELLGSGDSKTAPVKAVASFAAKIKEGKAALRSYKIGESDIEATTGATSIVLFFAGFQLRYYNNMGWSVYGRVKDGFKQLGSGETAKEALDSTKAVQRLKTGVPAGRAIAPGTTAPSGMYVFLAEHVRMSDQLVHYEWVRVRSVADAGKKVRAYISKNGLGNSTWMGGLLVEDGKVIGCVGYNGTFEDAAHPDTKMYVKRYATKFLNLLKKQMASTSSTSSDNEKYGSSRWVYLAKSGKVGTWREAPASRGQAGDIVRDYVDSNGLTDASFTGGLLIEDGDIIGRILSSGKFVHIESDHAGMKDYLKRAGNAAMALIRD